ncbi:MAG: redox-sensing transcriptional repressor Rex [Clostridiales bacterium]|nr:redox-sensing transcriptional repressor Rex [Clostridiales bacterium]
MQDRAPMSIQLFHRLISYLRHMKQLPPTQETVSSTTIATALGINDVQVRKDLALVSDKGRPKIGYALKDLIVDTERFLWTDSCRDAFIVGAGNLGKALVSYKNFAQYGIKIVAAFDCNPSLIGTKIGDVQVVDSKKLANLCERMNIHIGVITVPAEAAQETCDELVKGGVRAIWNFAPVNLQAPDHVVVRNEDMAASLAMLARMLDESLMKYGM